MSLYFVVAGGEVEGPKTALEIEHMVREGQITPEAQMSKTESPDDWFLLREWRPEFAAIAAKSESRRAIVAEKSAIADPRKALRSQTAYPKLRGILTFFAILDFIGAILFVIFIFCDPDRAPLFVTAAAACLLGLVPLALSNVLIDIADIGLKKLD